MALPILVTLHGGNFVGGDASWDGEQTALLRSLGFDVHQLAFAHSSLSDALASIRAQVYDLKQAHPQRSVAVLGRSSGGYLAKVLFDEGLFIKAVYLAPVFAPLVRAQLVPALGAASRSFFDQERHVPATDRWERAHELLLLADQDDKVPAFECFTAEQRAAALYLGFRTHNDMVKATTEAFATNVLSFLS